MGQYCLLNFLWSKFSNEVQLNDALSAFGSLSFYCILLLFIALITPKWIMRESNEKTRKEYESLFTIHVLAASVLFIILGLFGVEIENVDSFVVLGFHGFLLYIGFAASLKDIMEAKGIWQTFRCFVSPFMNIPFRKALLAMVTDVVIIGGCYLLYGLRTFFWILILFSIVFGLMGTVYCIEELQKEKHIK
jgi:hypothetical protein